MPQGESAQRYLIVDGHSILFAWDELRALHSRNAPAAREALCQRLRAYQDGTGERVVVVFDGRGPRTASERANPDDIQIMYSPSRRSADEVIERLAAIYASSRPVTVATADRLEQLTVFSFGALCISPEQLRDRVERAERDTRQRIERLRKKSP